MKKSFNILIYLVIIYLTINICSKLNIIKFILELCCMLKPLFIGILITIIINPIKKYFENKGIPKLMTIIIVYIIILLLAYMLFSNFIPKFIIEFQKFVDTLPDVLKKITDIFKIKVDNIKLEKDIISYLNNMYKRIPNVCMNAFNNIIDIVIGFIISFYLLMIDFNSDKEIILKINNIITNYIKATFITSLIIFILSTIVFYIFGLDNAFILGIICGITNIIPYVGPYIGAALPVLLMFTKSIKKGILISISIFIIQFIEGNIIGPLIIKKNIDIHPITSIIGLIIFSHFFGIVGAIIALPSIAIIKELYFYIKVLYN